MKTIITLRTGLLLAFIMALTNMVAQTTGDYRTTAATTINVITGWETYDGSAWVTPKYPVAGNTNLSVIQNGDTSTSATVALAAANPLIRVGQYVIGSGVPVGTTVSSISGTVLTLSQATTTSVSATPLTFADQFILNTTAAASSGNTITLTASNPAIVAGMAITGSGTGVTVGTAITVTSVSGAVVTLSGNVTIPAAGGVITFYTLGNTATTTAGTATITLKAPNSLVAVGMSVSSTTNQTSTFMPYGAVVTSIDATKTIIGISLPHGTTYTTGLPIIFGYNVIPNLYINHAVSVLANANTRSSSIGNVYVGNTSPATLSLGGNGTSFLVFACKTLNVASGSQVVNITSTGTNKNILALNGGSGGSVIDNNGTINFATSVGTGTSKLNTVFATIGNTAVTGTGTTAFNEITVNMGANTNTLDVQSVITMATAAAAPTLTLTSGTFKLSSASTLTAFGGNSTSILNSIPAAAGLYLNNAGANINWGTADATAATAAMSVNGLLTIANGNLQVKARFNVSTLGVFTMSGGALTIPAGFTITNVDNPMFIFQPTTFNITGGSFNIYNRNTSSSSIVFNRDINLGVDLPTSNFNIANAGIVNFYSGTTLKQVGNITVGTGATVVPSSGLAINGTLMLDGGICDVIGTNTLVFENGNTPIVKTSGNINVTSTSNLTFGRTGNTAGSAFVIPADVFSPAAPAINILAINRDNELTLNSQALTVNTLAITGTASVLTLGANTTITESGSTAAGTTLNIPVGTTLNLNEGKTLTNSGTITNNGDLILKSSATGTASLLSTTTVNNVTQQRYLSSNQRGWRLLSNPLATTTFGTLATNSTTPLTLGTAATGAYDSAANTWSSGTDADNMLSQQAYKVFVRGRTSEVTGTSYSVNPPSNVTVAIKGAATNAAPAQVVTTAGQYYLIANPYTAPVSVYSILGASTGLSTTVSYYNPTIGSSGSNADLILKYGGYANPTITAAAQGDANDVVLPPMGAIFVQATSNGTINIPKTAIFTGTVLGGSYNQKTAQTKVATTNALKVEVSSDGTYYDAVALQFKAVGDSRSNIDFGKLPNTVLDLYSINGSNKMAVSELELKEQTIPLGLTSTIQKSYSIKVAENTIPAGYEAVLVDKVLNTNTVLSPGTTYDFAIDSTPATQGNARFAINLKTSGALSLVEREFDSKIQLWPNPAAQGQFNILNAQNTNDGASTIEISSINGQVIHSQKSNPGTTTSIQTNGWAAGVYILKATNNGIQTTKKLIIQ